MQGQCLSSLLSLLSPLGRGWDLKTSDAPAGPFQPLYKPSVLSTSSLPLHISALCCSLFSPSPVSFSSTATLSHPVSVLYLFLGAVLGSHPLHIYSFSVFPPFAQHLHFNLSGGFICFFLFPSNMSTTFWVSHFPLCVLAKYILKSGGEKIGWKEEGSKNKVP